MKAVILAAGVGSRLAPITDTRPKCLVRVSGRAILDYQIEALLKGGCTDLYVVGGYRASQIEQHLSGSELDCVSLVQNPVYAETNNMYSLHLCRELIAGDPFILVNGDVVLDAAIAESLVSAAGSAVAVDEGAFNDESMKVALDADGAICHIAKTIDRQDAFGCSIDAYRFCARDSEVLFEHIDRVIESGNRTDWTEVALDALFSEGAISAIPIAIGAAHWYEIDDLDDLAAASLLFGRPQLNWDDKKLAFVDMDGTLFCGQSAIPGADAFFRELSRRVDQVLLLSNNSSKSHDEYVSKLAGQNIAVAASSILLSTDGLAFGLQTQGITRVYVLGTDACRDVLAGYGIEHVEHGAQCVVLGYDTTLTYAKLCKACLLLQDPDVAYWATHCDVVCPTENGDIPDIGATMALIEAACGRRPDRVFGKPSIDMLKAAMDARGATASQCLMVGDRGYTAYEMAKRAGIQFIGVLTGDSDLAAYQSCQNTIVVPSVADLFVQNA